MKSHLSGNTLAFLKSSRAFSLLEILIVLSVIAFIFVFVAQRFSRKEQKVTGTFNKLVRLNRRLVLLSKFHNNIYRWVIQLDNEGAEKYWVEKKQEIPSNTDSSHLADSQVKDQEGGLNKEESPEFIRDDAFYSEPEVISPLLNITGVESFAWEKDKTEGLVYIYYYPRGLAQETAIQFLRPDNQGRWTLYLDPVTKNLQVLDKERRLSKRGGLK